ncbi:hypothetical protein [Shigella sonnei]|nr:hypothetical protein [Shigella sonnei]SJE79932.1 phosphoglucosamine mutase [Shigella sonnei]
MVRKYFGTDGIRGKANEGAMTAETALRRFHLDGHGRIPFWPAADNV